MGSLRRCAAHYLCLTRAQLLTSAIGPGGELEALTLSQDPLRLRSTRLDQDVSLQLRQQFRLVREEGQPRSRQWHVSTAAYFYQLDDHQGRELAAWHWHPATGVQFPHMHVSGGLLEKQMHLPTGRVSIESILRLLMTELDVRPTKAHAGDYLEILGKTESDFIGYRRWHA